MNAERRVVLVTTDGSAHSRRILPHAGAFALASGADLVLTQVIQPEEITPESGETQSAALARTIMDVEAELSSFLDRSRIHGRALVGVPQEDEKTAAAILRLAAEHHAVLLAMDTRGHGMLRHAIMGSVALDVLSKTSLPVMLSGAELSDPPMVNGTYRLIATSDGSPASEDVVRALSPLLTPESFAVTLLRVHEMAPHGEGEAAELLACEQQLQGIVSLFPAGLQIETKVRPVPRLAGIDTAIIEEAESLQANAIAISTHGVGANRHVLAGSVMLTLLGRSPLPLITSRATAE